MATIAYSKNTRLKTMSISLPGWWRTPMQAHQLQFFAHYMLFLSCVLVLALSWFHWVYHIHLPDRMYLLWLPLQLIGTFLLYLVLPRFKSLSQGQVLALFVFSLLVLAGYLYDSGGAINPLIHILIAPIAIGLVIFSRQPAFILILLTTAIYFLLNRFYVPIMSMKIPSLNAFFDWHLSGSAAVFLGISVLVMMIVFPLRQKLDAQQQDLLKNQKQALQHEYLLALATFAASSAHRLGTPLNTLSLIESSLRQTCPSSQAQQDLDIMADQLNVCQKALSNIRRKADQSARPGRFSCALSDFIAEVKEEFTLLHPMHELPTTLPDTSITLHIDNSLSLAVLNLLENAARYSPDYVALRCESNDDGLVFQVIDHGQGLRNTELSQLGKRPLTQSDGEGIGLYLTQMIVERYQGELHFERAENETRAEIRLPKSVMEAPTHE